MTRRQLSTGKKILFCSIPLLVLCGAAEVFTRVFYGDPLYKPFIIRKSNYLPFTTPPNTTCFVRHPGEYHVRVRFDENGFRVPFGPERPLSARKSLYLGDSFTLGFGLKHEETYVGLLEQKLLDRRSIFNAGYTAGISPDSYYAYLVRNHERLGIDEAVVFLFYNDIDDMISNVWTQLDDHGAPVELHTKRSWINYKGEPLDPAVWAGAPNFPIVRHSLFYRKAATRLLEGIRARSAPPADRDAMIEIALSEFEAVARAMAEYCALNRLGLAFVVIPPIPATRDAAEFRRIDTTMKRVLSELEGVRTLSLDASLSTEHYYPEDKHLNAAGAAIVAEAVWQRFYEDEMAHLPEAAAKLMPK